MTISNEIREYVRQRAGDRCEYCLSQQEYVMGRLQIDHIQPISKGGIDTEENIRRFGLQYPGFEKLCELSIASRLVVGDERRSTS